VNSHEVRPARHHAHELAHVAGFPVGHWPPVVDCGKSCKSPKDWKRPSALVDIAVDVVTCRLPQSIAVCTIG